MKKVTLYVACSIDGYIAKPDGSLDWLDALPNPGKIDHGYGDLLENTSCILMGRKTYVKLLSFGIDWPYPEIKTFVVTSDKTFVASTPNTDILTGNIATELERIRTFQEKDIWLVGGGELVTFFLNNDLIDRMILSFVPVILGEGIPLFPGKSKETQWTLTGSIAFPTGIASLTYERS
jgi:dihydrofolate reductase